MDEKNYYSIVKEYYRDFVSLVFEQENMEFHEILNVVNSYENLRAMRQTVFPNSSVDTNEIKDFECEEYKLKEFKLVYGSCKELHGACNQKLKELKELNVVGDKLIEFERNLYVYYLCAFLLQEKPDCVKELEENIPQSQEKEADEVVNSDKQKVNESLDFFDFV